MDAEMAENLNADRKGRDADAAARTLSQDTPLSFAQEAEALHVALRGMSIGHLGYLHPDGQPFRYQPRSCPGCAYSVIREMFRERGGRGG
jgi:hypothetical protein